MINVLLMVSGILMGYSISEIDNYVGDEASGWVTMFMLSMTILVIVVIINYLKINEGDENVQ